MFRIKRWLEDRPYRRAPYSQVLYHQVLERSLIRNGNERDLTVCNHMTNPSEGPRAVLRHDVDSSECLANTLDLSRIQLELGITSSWYFRIDGFRYAPNEARDTVSRLRNDGHDVGLHVAPYIYLDTFAGLDKALEIFESELGFRPKTMTIHGFHCGPILQDRRRRFVDELAERSGYPFCDTAPNVYHAYMSDCRPNRGRTGRHITRSDWMRLNRVETHNHLCVLIHPGYWGPQGVKMSSPAL